MHAGHLKDKEGGGGGALGGHLSRLQQLQLQQHLPEKVVVSIKSRHSGLKSSVALTNFWVPSLMNSLQVVALAVDDSGEYVLPV